MEGIGPLRNPGWPRPGTHFIVKILRLQAEDVPELVCVVSEKQSSRKQRSEKNFGGSEEKGVVRKATDVR